MTAAFSKHLLPDEPPKRIGPHLALPEWMAEYRPLLQAGRPFDLSEHAYLAGIYADDWPLCIYCKAGQMGISEYLVSWILYMAAEMDSTGLYVLPTDKHVSDFSAARLGPAIEPAVSPRLAAMITSAAGGKRGADRVGLKRVGNRFVYFRGGQIKDGGAGGDADKAAQLKTVDADALVLDELDELDKRVPPFVRERLGHSAVNQQRIASTPTLADVGIHAEYKLSDMREWLVPCPACGERQPLDLSNLVIEWDALDRPVAWYGKAEGEPYLACRKCQGRLDRSARGEWVAQYPGRAAHGYLIPGLASARKPLAGIIEGLESTDETTRQQTYNQKLGLTYTSRLSEKITDSLLNDCRREYTMGQVSTETPWMGVDVGLALNVIIRAKMLDGNTILRYAGQVESFDDIEHLIRAYNVRAAVIDALPETRKVRELQALFPRFKVWLSYFATQKTGSQKESAAEWDARELHVNVDRTRAMDHTLGKFRSASLRDDDGKPLPGNTLPADAQAIRDYYAHLKAPERVQRAEPQGNKIYVYVNSKPDHYAFAELYAAMAMLCPYQGWSRGSG